MHVNIVRSRSQNPLCHSYFISEIHVFSVNKPPTMPLRQTIFKQVKNTLPYSPRDVMSTTNRHISL
ncbi:MAG: hypothetical protein ACLU99_01455 [Alphaproteobacteria bacterium]